ncbi:methionine synthase [Methanobrevibacter olleyae]|uniref:5-methyltetrahydropteroyltriglutamate--homocysteine methyltransferase n=1 Tax=Methanobrevibacter olleyae TaxID=294671 RepID=A0A126QZX5_METOL|nr:methionine synthase [Methanobrevibacter olleyae]AMK15670.1 methionine synthase MetE [Methanobrevibacter olleyae]SFL23437.1 5-methyltetrahydropteroyltriglutamate--homocysteine methyltransferase [Methanobrevibacter olleyae]
MITTVVGSFGIDLKEPKTFVEKLKSSIGLYDPYKIAIEEAVKLQLNCGVDIIGDGQPRGDMVASFVKHIPGFSYEMNSSVILSKIRAPQVDIMIKDLKYAQKVLANEIKTRDMSPEEASRKGVKLILTGPSTIVHSSRIESFYKERNPAIIDCAYALRREVESAEKSGAKYVQIDDPFLSTGMVDLKVAKESIAILTDGIEIPMAMHVCGNLNECFKDIAKFPIDILDCEFAGNNVNIGVLEENADLLKGKKLGFGCVDSALNAVDDKEEVKALIQRGIDAVGKEKMILDPDCGLRKVDIPIAMEKLKIISDLAKEFN